MGNKVENNGLKMTARLRVAGVLVFVGLLIEAFTLTWNNPISFLVFLGIGGLLTIVGILFYLLSLVSPSAAE
jgi:hypothetical protein